MRLVLFVASIVVAVLALISWQGDRGRVGTERVERTTRAVPAHDGQGAGRTFSQRRVSTVPSSELRSQSLTIALSTIALGLLAAAAFWDRLSELRLGALRVKLDADKLRRIRERTDDPEKAFEALELFVRKIESIEKAPKVAEKLADDAIDAAVEEVQSELADHVEILDPDTPEIAIEGQTPADNPVFRVTSDYQYLPQSQFSAELIDQIALDVPAVQRIYVLEQVDVLAAVSYRALPDAPLLIRAVATRNDRPDLQPEALAAALLATRYLHHVSEALGRPPGLMIAVEEGRAHPVTLQELGFRKAGPKETVGLPEADYWVQDKDAS